jgi:hypothetical protein
MHSLSAGVRNRNSLLMVVLLLLHLGMSPEDLAS